MYLFSLVNLQRRIERAIGDNAIRSDIPAPIYSFRLDR